MLNFQDLRTSKGEKVIVHEVGNYNTNEGPDFLHAKIEIAGITWFGSIEIHTKLSDWKRHNHDANKNYETVVLHLVYEIDIENEINSIPIIELKNYIPQNIIDQYDYWKNFNKGFIPCENDFLTVDSSIKNIFLESLYLERLEEKTKIIEQELITNQYDWEAVFFKQFAYAIGLKVNASAFYNLANSIPFSLIQKASKNNWDLEALLFGQAGFLEKPDGDEYQAKLTEIYGFYKHKYQLSPINNEQFKFFRLRPPGFPTIRIAQLASIYQNKESVFSSLIQLKSLDEFYTFFQNIKLSDYWLTHYQLSKESHEKSTKTITKAKIDLLLINAILPMKFAYEKIMGNSDYEDIMEIISEIQPEDNSIINQYKKLGLKPTNAIQTQASLHLNKFYCNQKRCLNCAIGIEILRKQIQK